MTPRKKNRGAKSAGAVTDAFSVETPKTGVTAVAPEPLQPTAVGFPIVGIGASAGGLAAFEAFFSGMPADADPGMAFVLVQHLDPNHKSILGDLIRRYTRMQVFEVEDGMVVRPNCAYIIPPNRDMAFLSGTLQLLEPSSPRGQRLPIDFFFRSLAQDQRERAIGIVLSGTGSDGTLGVRAIKGERGMVMAQNPASSEYDGMPRSALATGLVDYELPPAEMPTQLMAFVARAIGHPARRAAASVREVENALKKVFVLLRAQSGHDFSLYKPSTVHRRIERRMAVHQIDAMDSYLKYLQKTPDEANALFRDLLIGVTSFFRDPEAFKVVEDEIITKILADKSPDAQVRVWSPGCSTGEEAYSLAILLAERLEAMKRTCKVQVFATDIDSEAIATARGGRYPASIATDLSPERLARFFAVEPDGGGYRVHKSIRDMLVFSEQSLIKDPPFSKLDLLSCRNVLIYMGGDLQKKLIPLFHYALNPGGFLFLGTSETVGDADDLFTVLDRKAKLYLRRGDVHSAQRPPLGRFLPPMTAVDGAPVAGKAALPAKPPLRQLAEQVLLEEVAPAGALVNGRGDILYLHGRTGRYLEPSPGEAGVNNILKMAREGLRRDLTTTLRKAAGTREVARCPGLRVKTNGDFITINVTIHPVKASPPETPLYLVVLEEAPVADAERPPVGVAGGAGADGLAADTDERISALAQELKAKEEYLQSANEELETSNEELKSANEEMQSVNEELQSTNEELETSKEELQSVNEELATVNAELQTKVADLSRAYNDMNNLLAGTGIATVFVDLQLRILRFTPTANAIINLILSDVGRPVSHVASNLVGYDRLAADAKAVLDTLVPKEVDVQTTDDKWFAMRIMPYRTLDNVIEGAVITFVDITEMEKTRAALRKANDLGRLALMRDSRDAITIQDLDGRILVWSPGATRMYGWSEAEALAMNVHERIPQELHDAELARVKKLIEGEALGPYCTQRIARGQVVLDVWMTCTALVNEAGRVIAVGTTESLKRP
jgi:two-component system, chemotaxis family, CheB/CheR fusion protein